MALKLMSTGGGSVTLDVPSTASNLAMTVPAGNGTLVTSNDQLTFRNRIINGDMRIDQRRAGAVSTISLNNEYSLDRWKSSSFLGTSATQQQVTDAPPTFSHSLKYTVVTGSSPGSTNTELLSQGIEGNNIVDAAFGTSAAKQLTLSFWVKSSVTGTFCVAFNNSSNPRVIGDASRSYVTTYTISAANTWEQKTITIAGDTTGTWNTTTGVGLAVQFPFGVGSTFSTSTANTWLAGSFGFITGTQQFTATTGATWQVTGVQLEVAPNATAFERRSFSTEMALSNRYYWTSYPSGTAVGSASALYPIRSVGHNIAYENLGSYSYPVPMRVAPTNVLYNASTGAIGSYTADANTFTEHVVSTTPYGFFAYSSTRVIGTSVFTSFHLTANAEF